MNKKEKKGIWWVAVAGFISIGVILVGFSAWSSIEFFELVGINLISVPVIMIIWCYLNGDPLSKEINNVKTATDLLGKTITTLGQTIDRKEILDNSGLFNYSNKIRFTSSEKWYKCIKDARETIYLMSPCLIKWFDDKDIMKNLLFDKALQGCDIRFLIMGHENISCKNVTILKHNTKANVGFYDPVELKKNENLIKSHLLDINKKIEDSNKSSSPNFIKAKALISTPVFTKVEIFGDILHWSFFGHSFDGKIAPSFWVQKKLNDSQNQNDELLGLYNILKNEFKTIWEAKALTRDLDIYPSIKNVKTEKFSGDIQQITSIQ